MAAVALPLALLGGQLVAGELSGRKKRKASKEREEAIDRENRKGAIARALGAPSGTARQLPSGEADTSLLDTLGGLSGVGSSLAFRQGTGAPTNQVQATGRPVATNTAILRQLQPRNVQGSFPIRGRNIG